MRALAYFAVLVSISLGAWFEMDIPIFAWGAMLFIIPFLLLNEILTYRTYRDSATLKKDAERLYRWLQTPDNGLKTNELYSFWFSDALVSNPITKRKKRLETLLDLLAQDGKLRKKWTGIPGNKSGKGEYHYQLIVMPLITPPERI